MYLSFFEAKRFLMISSLGGRRGIMGRREESRLYFILGVCGHAVGTCFMHVRLVLTAMNGICDGGLNGICELVESRDCFARNQNENQK